MSIWSTLRSSIGTLGGMNDPNDYLRTPGFNPNAPRPGGSGRVPVLPLPEDPPLLPPMRSRPDHPVSGRWLDRPPELDGDRDDFGGGGYDADMDDDGMSNGMSMPELPATSNPGARPSPLTYETEADRKLREFRDRAEASGIYKTPEPSWKRRLGASLLSGAQGFLRGTGSEMPTREFEQSVQGALYGDYPIRRAEADAEYERLLRDSRSQHDLLKNQIDLQKAEAKRDYYSNENKRRSEEGTRSHDLRVEEQKDKDLARRTQAVTTAEAQERERAKAGLYPADSPHVLNPDGTLKPGWVSQPMQTLVFDPNLGGVKVETRNYVRQVEIPVPAHLGKAFQGRQTATEAEIKAANAAHLQQIQATSREKVAQMTAGTKQAIAAAGRALQSQLQAGRLDQQAMFMYEGLISRYQADITDLEQQAINRKAALYNPAIVQDPKVVEEQSNKIDQEIQQRVQQVQAQVNRLMTGMSAPQTMRQGAGIPAAPRSTAPRPPSALSAPPAAPSSPIVIKRGADGKLVKQ